MRDNGFLVTILVILAIIICLVFLFGPIRIG